MSVTKYRPSLPFIGFIQASGLFTYCCLIGLLMWKGNKLFGTAPSWLGPAAFLALFIISAVICALIYLGYAFLLFWDRKDTPNALKLVIFTTGWLALFISMVLLSFFLLK